jgi:raffinose/stachyose/melibiose transport system substrate-binding protein
MRLSIDRHRRRAVAVALPLAAGLLLAGCGGSSNSGGSNGAEPQSITLTFASANTTEMAFDDLAKAYMAAHPGVEIKTNRIALDGYNQALSTQMQAGNGPDVMYINAGSGQAASIGQFGKAGLLLELDKSVAADIPDAQMEGYTYQDKLLGLPSATIVDGVIYNDVLAQQSGVKITATSTLNGITDQCAAVKATGKSIFGLAGSVPANNGILAAQLATSTVYGPNPNWNQDRTDGKTTFADTPGWQQALQSVVDLNNAGCFQDGAAGAGFDALTNGSSTGQFFGFFAPSGATKDIMDAAGGAVTLVALGMPAPQGTESLLTVSANQGLAGNAKTQSPKLVADFLKFSVSPEPAKAFAASQGSIPVGKINAADLLPQYKPVADQLVAEEYRPFAVDGWPNGQVYDALGTGVTGLLTGQNSVNDVLASMDSAWG